ncbi:MAG: hypothetical protein COS41_04270 [Elusimicrobia bacterium CG03_land_8_20_14_0_80_50_18]|nr:MAG: hypothetical protein COS41_04270 [Elusimicrobia bacterium CG03_land_8_20_14_0_80_50_18]PIX16552.1 MAG: hypothetical protein COZ72_00600 [Elusimicrobia bacterium CG_4_8_14_3_um_filter_50_9]
MAAARRLEFITAANAKEALILEEQLIKLLRPKYNVVMTDDKNYPYICVTDEKYPRFLYSRGRKTANCFGPYPDASSLKLSMRRLLRIFGLPLCTRQQYDRISRLGRAESCIYYHLVKCPAPCCGKIEVKEYMRRAGGLISFLKGEKKFLLRELEKKMKKASAAADYEEALRIRQTLDAFREVQESVDIVSADAGKYLFRPAQALKDIRKLLNLKRLPGIIDGIDISHIQGSNTVASAVRFVKGLPDKSSYRKYAMRAKGIDDCAMVKEAVRRRYRKESADLILIDGGEGQLNAALESIKKLGKKMEVISLAKREEIIYRDNMKALKLPKDSPALRLLMYVRDEAHRFAVAYHRRKRREAVNGR